MFLESLTSERLINVASKKYMTLKNFVEKCLTRNVNNTKSLKKDHEKRPIKNKIKIKERRKPM